MVAPWAVAVAGIFVWLGMVLAISFIEAPLKFRAPGSRFSWVWASAGWYSALSTPRSWFSAPRYWWRWRCNRHRCR